MKADGSLYTLQGFRFAAGNPMEASWCQSFLLQRKFNPGTSRKRFDTNLRVIFEAVVHFSVAWHLPDFWFRIANAIGFGAGGAGHAKNINSVVDVYCEARRDFLRNTRRQDRPGPKSDIAALADEIITVAALSPTGPQASQVKLWDTAARQWPGILVKVVSRFTQPDVSQATGQTEFKIRGLAALDHSTSLASRISAPLMSSEASTISNGSGHAGSSTSHQNRTGQPDASVHEDQNSTLKPSISHREDRDGKPRTRERKKDRKASFGSHQDDQSEVSVCEQQNNASKPTIADKQGQDARSGTKQQYSNVIFVRAGDSPKVSSISRRSSIHRYGHDNDGHFEVDMPEVQLDQNLKEEKASEVQQQPSSVFPGQYAPLALVGKEASKLRSFLPGSDDEVIDLISSSEDERASFYIDVGPRSTRKRKAGINNVATPHKRRATEKSVEESRSDCHNVHQTVHDQSSEAPHGGQDDRNGSSSAQSHDGMPDNELTSPDSVMKALRGKSPSPDTTNESRRIERSSSIHSPELNEEWDNEITLVDIAEKTDSSTKSTPATPAKAVVNDYLAVKVAESGLTKNLSSESNVAVPEGEDIGQCDLASEDIPQSDLASRVTDLESIIQGLVKEQIQGLVKELNETRQTLDAKTSNDSNLEARLAQNQERIDKLEAQFKHLQPRTIQSPGTSSNGPPTPDSKSTQISPTPGTQHLQYLHSLDVRPFIAAVKNEIWKIRVVMKSKLMELPDKPTTNEGLNQQLALGDVMWALDEAMAKADRGTQKIL